jgi:chromosome segregation ATPase
MTGTILEPRTDEHRPSVPEPLLSGSTTPPRQRRGGLIAVWGAVALLGGYSLWGVQSSRSTLGQQRATLGELSGRLEALATENAGLKSQLADARSQLDHARERLGAVDAEADRARTLALRNRSEAQRTAERLGGAIDEQRTQVGALTESVDGVKGDVGANRTDIDRALGNLGEQGGLIARNREELDALKRMGTREYFDFELRKSNEFTRVGPMALRLNKTDEKHQRYTVTVVVDDKRVEKKDNALFEPVQFYVPGSRTLLELVASEIGDGRVVGHVSRPKETASQS